MPDLKQELRDSLFDLGIMEKQPCTRKENKEFNRLRKDNIPLPDGVYKFNDYNEYYRIKQTELTQDEIDRFMTYRQVRYLKSIRNCMIFFVVMSVISMLMFFFLR